MVGECRRGGLLSLFDLRAVSNILGRRALVCTTPHDIVQPGYRIWHIGVTELFELRPRISMPVRRDRFVNDDSIRRDFDDDVQIEDRLVFTRGVYAMLASAYDSDCGHDDLFFALSDDVIHCIHFSRPLL